MKRNQFLKPSNSITLAKKAFYDVNGGAKLNWEFSGARNSLEKAKSTLKLPSSLLFQKESSVAWYERTLEDTPFCKIELFDENIFSISINEV
jgi:hypothetical protein